MVQIKNFNFKINLNPKWNEHKPRLSMTQKHQILSMWNQGETFRNIAENVECSTNAVKYTCDKFQQTGNINEQNHSGRPLKLNERDNRQILQYVIRDPYITSVKAFQNFNETQLDTKHISPSYIRQLYQTNGFKALTRPRKWYIRPENRPLRVKFAREYLTYGTHYWQTLVFSDGSWVSGGTGRRYVCLRKRQRNLSRFAKISSSKDVKF